MTQNPDAATQAPPRNTLDDLFGRLRSSGFYRDTDRRWFGGVCSGLAARFGVDPLLIRAAAIVLTFVGGLGITAYLVLWLILPDRRGTLLLERALRRGEGGPVVLLVVTAFVIVGGFVSISAGDTWGGPLWVLLAVALIAWFVIERSRGGPRRSEPTTPPDAAPGAPATGASPTTPPALPAASAAGTEPSTSGVTMSGPTQTYPPSGAAPVPPPAPPRYGYPTPPYGGTPTPPPPARPIAPPPPPGPRRRRPSGFIGLISLGLAVTLFGAGIALDGPLAFPGVAAVLGFALALAGVSVVALALGISGRAGGFTSFLVIALSFLLLTTAGASRVRVADGVGNRTWVPVASSSSTLRAPIEYSLGTGEATLDLRRLPEAGNGSPVRVSADVGAGNLQIIVPEDLTASVDAHVGLGDIRVRGTASSDELQRSGPDRSLSVTVGDTMNQADPDVLVTADVGIGEITIEEN
jgi:phage shock protein PspC (stress-responsive transcriptional regulator)